MSAWELYPEVGREIYSTARSTAGPPDPGAFSGIMGAIGRAFPAAYNEALSAITGIATEYGRAAAVTYGAKPAQSIELLGSPAPIADQYRAQAKALVPDPLTTGVASRFVFDAARVLTKAAALGVAGGVPLAAAGTGALEGTLESQKLKDQGVDAITAAKVGAIKGLSTGVGLALPVAGRTLLETAGLVVAGGPVSFMAEKAAARAVLEHADYSAIAHEYDPFDPAGLALSVAVPGMFGAAVHGARAVGASRAARRAAVTAEEVEAARVAQLAQHIDETRLAAPDNAAGVEAHAEALSTARAQIDAGERVSVADQVPASDVPYGRPYFTAAERVERAVERAQRRGDDVTLDPDATFRPGTPAADMAAPAAIARATQLIGRSRLRELADQALADEGRYAELVGGAARALTPEEVARVEEHVARQVIDQKGKSSLQPEIAELLEDPDLKSVIIGMRAEAGWAEEGGRLIRGDDGEVTGRTPWVPNAEWWPGRPDSLSQGAVERAVDKAIAGDRLTAAEARTIRYMAEYARERVLGEPYHATPAELEAAGLRGGVDEFDAAVVARAAERDEALVERLAIEHGDNDAAFMRAIKEFLDESDNEIARSGESGAREEGGGEGGRETGAGERDPVAEAARSVVDDVPDLRVFDELTGEEVTAAELWRRAEEAYQADAREAEGYGAAVSCFLRSGA